MRLTVNGFERGGVASALQIHAVDLFDGEKGFLAEEVDLIDEEKDLFDEEKDLFDEEKDLFEQEKDLFDEEKDLFDEEKDLFDEEKDLIEQEIDLFDEEKDPMFYFFIPLRARITKWIGQPGKPSASRNWFSR